MAARTLVYVLAAVLAGPFWRAPAGVRVDAVDALAAVEAEIAAAVVDVDLTPGTLKT